MSARPVLLLIAISARALIAAARRAGFAAVAIDAFADVDARAGCLETMREEGAMQGFANVALDACLARLCAAHAPVGLVYGSGFDDCPQALAPLARHVRVFGAPEAMEACKDPWRFARACAEAGIAHPAIAAQAPGPGWLLKRRGGSGGGHVSPATRAPIRGEYAQARVEGRAVSLLFVRDSLELTPIAWSAQWTAPAPGAPYRYGGAAGPCDVTPPSDLLHKLGSLTAALGVRGLASADFIEDGATFWLLEINPRPGATLDLFDDESDPLLARHIAAFADTPAAPVPARASAAAEIVYAQADSRCPAGDWPDWAHDRPAPGTPVPEGAPFCTVTARAETATQARGLVRERARRMQDWLQETCK